MPMLSKAATSFRPFLRFQTHQPDLFTSNPNLLHHFQQHGLVVQGAAQTATGSGGAAGGAGRSGFGASSGGYTGHARAFLSLPQGTGADASSATTSAEERDKAKAARQRAALALKQRTAKADNTLPRTVMMQERMAQRAGSRPVALVEMRDETTSAKEIEDGSGSRPSIAYPTWSALPADAAPGGALWLPGSAPRPIGARAFSTSVRATADDEIPVPMIAAASGAIPTTNFVLQDLAGLDIGRPGRGGQIRRNSTASVVRPDVDAVLQGDNKSADQHIYNAINAARQRQPEDALRIIEHYRTPRSAVSPSAGDPELAAKLPLPAGYTTPTYNLCLQVMLENRQRGDSIAPILDMYNEMLSRDVVPNMRTTALVIRALCLREEDVSAASRRWMNSHADAAFKRTKLGVDHSASADSSAEEAIKAYQSEDNIASALNLYNVASSFYPRKSQGERDLMADLINAASTSIGLPHAAPLESILPVIQAYLQAAETDLAPFVAVFDLLATGNDTEVLNVAWDRLVERTQYLLKSDESSMHAATATNAREATAAAIGAFVALGDKTKAFEIIEQALPAAATPPQQRELYAALVSALAKSGDAAGALEWAGKARAKGVSLATQPCVFDLADTLIAAGRVPEAVEFVDEMRQRNAQENPGRHMDRRRIRSVYAQVLVEALSNPELVEALNKAAVATSPNLDLDLLSKHVQLLVDTGRYTDIAPLLLRFPARQRTEDIASDRVLRDALVSLVQSDAPLSAVLDSLRGFARLGQSVADPTDAVPLGALVIAKYVAARGAVDKTEDLKVALDGWFRLLESLVAVPPAQIDAGAIDSALETFMADIAEFKTGRFQLPNTFVTSHAVSELAEILSARFGVERASELLLTAFGQRAAGILPTPDATVAASSEAAEFTLPPTPESAQSPPAAFQPPSEHTLHLDSRLVSLVDRLAVPSTPVTPAQVYAQVREAIAKENAVPSPEAIGRLIAALARAGDEHKARELYSLAQVVLASCVPEPRAQAEAWCAVEDSMISACCFLGQLEQAGMHRARIIDAGMAPSADAYATMIACSRDSTDDALVARELFDESQALGVVPHLYLFNTIISKLSKARKAEMALELFQHMKAAGIRPSSVTYGAVINACCRVGDAESAELLFEEMSHQPNFKPRVPPFNTMMQFHLQTRPSREKVLYYFDAMRGAGVRPSAHTYKLLLDAYGTLAPVDLAAMDRVFADLCRDRHVPVQGTHWASLITAFGLHAGDVDKAVAVFDSIATHPTTNKAGVPEPVVWEAILNVLGQKGSLEQLDAMRSRMLASGARSTAYVCNVLIAGYSQHGAIERAREVFEGMGDSLTGVAAPNNHPALLTSSGHVKPSTMTSAPTEVVYREPSTYEAMVRAELSAGDRARAESVLARMEERRYPVAVWMKARAILDEQI